MMETKKEDAVGEVGVSESSSSSSEENTAKSETGDSLSDDNKVEKAIVSEAEEESEHTASKRPVRTTKRKK